MKLGIMGAMPEEVDLIKQRMNVSQEDQVGSRVFVCGTLDGIETVLVFSRWGKVASASTATTLINKYQVELIIFTGVAGAVDPSLNVGDVVIANKLYQHDMDATPIFPKFHIPLTDTLAFTPNESYAQAAKIAAEQYIKDIEADIPKPLLEEFSIQQPKVMTGTIATGDQFVADTLTHENMHFSDSEKAHAVEMEGAAVAQVCEEYQLPYLVIRTISDKADHSATVDFQSFIQQVSNHYSRGILRELIRAEALA